VRVRGRCPPFNAPEPSLRLANGLVPWSRPDYENIRLTGAVPFLASRWPRPGGLSRGNLPNNAKAQERTKQGTRQFDCQLYS